MKTSSPPASNKQSLPSNQSSKPGRWFAALKQSLRAALRILAVAIRDRQPPAALPGVHAAFHALEKAGNQEQPASRADLHFVVSETKRVTSTIKRLNQLLSAFNENALSSREKTPQSSHNLKE